MKKINELTLKQHKNNPVKYLDGMKLENLLIDEKDPNAYSDNSYVKDILFSVYACAGWLLHIWV